MQQAQSQVSSADTTLRAAKDNEDIKQTEDTAAKAAAASSTQSVADAQQAVQEATAQHEAAMTALREAEATKTGLLTQTDALAEQVKEAGSKTSELELEVAQANRDRGAAVEAEEALQNS